MSLFCYVDVVRMIYIDMISTFNKMKTVGKNESPCLTTSVKVKYYIRYDLRFSIISDDGISNP